MLSRTLGVFVATFVGVGALSAQTGEAKFKEVLRSTEQSRKTLDMISEKINGFVKNKEVGNETDAQKDVEAAIACAERLAKFAKEWQTTIAKPSPMTEKEKAEILRKSLFLSHGEMKKAVMAATDKYGKAESMGRFLQALERAEGEFAVIVRKK